MRVSRAQPVGVRGFDRALPAPAAGRRARSALASKSGMFVGPPYRRASPRALKRRSRRSVPQRSATARASLPGLGLRNKFVTCGTQDRTLRCADFSAARRRRAAAADRRGHARSAATRRSSRARRAGRARSGFRWTAPRTRSRRVEDRQRAHPSRAWRSATPRPCTTPPRRCAARASPRTGWRRRPARRCARSRTRVVAATTSMKPGSMRGGATGYSQKTANAITFTSTSELRSGR